MTGPAADGSPFGSTLFLSCDLVGSTSHKQSAGDALVWIPDFLGFYYDFPPMVRRRITDRDLADRLTFWKAVGDELLYSVAVRHEKEVDTVVRAWLGAMDEYEAELAARNEKLQALPEGESGAADGPLSGRVAPRNNMKTKGGAFIATFPSPDYVVAVPLHTRQPQSRQDPLVRNRELIEGAEPDRLIDYLGPSIDTGFRVVHLSGQRYFTMSVEVAWAMGYHQAHGAAQDDFDGLVLLGEEPMKGVWRGREYPVFAIDRLASTDIVQQVNKARGVGPIRALTVCRLAEACHADGNWPSKIFMENSSAAEFTAARDELVDLQERYQTVTDRSGENAGMAADDDGAVGSRDVDEMKTDASGRSRDSDQKAAADDIPDAVRTLFGGRAAHRPPS